MGPVLGFLGAIVFGVGASAGLAYTLAVNIARFALLSLVSRFLAPKIDLQQTAEDKLFTVKSAIQPQAFVYGQDMLSGPLIFTNVSGDSNEYLHRLVALTGRELDDFVAFRIDDTDLVIGTQIATRNGTVSSGNFADVVTIATELGTSTQTAIAQLVTDFPTLWTSAHRARGWSLLYVRMEIVGGNTAFEKGVPQNLRALVKGHKCYDPRQDSTSAYYDASVGVSSHRLATPSTWTWTANPAICLADWLMWEQVGLGEETDRIDWELVAESADVCDELVTIPPASPATTQKRYTCNFTFYADQERGQIKQILEGAMLGRCIFSQGKWRMYAGEARTPTVTLDEQNLAGGVHVEASTAAKQRYNTVRGKFVDPTRDYHANAYPEQTNSSYVTDDNSEVKYKTVDFNACNNSYECQRNAITVNRQSRNQKVVRFEGNWSCFRIQVGDVVDLSIVELGWDQDAGTPTDKKFLVTEWALGREFRGVELVMVEENDSVWTAPAVGDYTTRSPTGELLPPDEPPVALTDATISNKSQDQPIYAGVRADATGRLRYGDQNNVYRDTLVPIGQWLGSGVGPYSIKATLNSGTLESGTTATWEALSADRTWYVEKTNDTDPNGEAVVQLDIAETADTATILATGTFDLYAIKPVVVIAGTALITNTNSSEAINIPAVSAGQLMLCVCARGQQFSSGVDLFNSPGWTKIKSDYVAEHINVYARIGTGDSNDDANTSGSVVPRFYQVFTVPVPAWSGAGSMVTLERAITGTTSAGKTSTDLEYPDLPTSTTGHIQLIVSVKERDDASNQTVVSAPDTDSDFTLISSGYSDFDTGLDFICGVALKVEPYDGSTNNGTSGGAGKFPLNGTDESSNMWSIAIQIKTDDFPTVRRALVVADATQAVAADNVVLQDIT